MRLKDKVVLITGASRGVGRACALACAREGAKLAIAAKTMTPHPKLPGTLPETAAEVEALGGEVETIQVDVRFDEQVRAMVERTVERFGRLDAVVNNAGAIHLNDVADFPAKRFDLVVGINVRAAFLTSQAAIPHLRAAGGGHVLMMSPPVNPAAAAGKAPYLVSKIGMTVIAQAIDAEEELIAAHALWPVTMIKTAATLNFGLGSEEEMRTPEILADATAALLARDPKACSFRPWLDEEVLREEGVTDFSRYNCVEGSNPSPASILLVDPSYTG